MVFHVVRWPLHSGSTPTLEKTRLYLYLLNTINKTSIALIPEHAYAGDPGEYGEYGVKQPDW